jgi:hypothetical protein
VVDEAALERKGSANRPVNVAVKAYDPTGLRATTTATWAEMDKALAVNALPNHIFHPEWEKDIDEIAKECESKGIPMRFGRRQKWQQASATYNKLKW